MWRGSNSRVLFSGQALRSDVTIPPLWLVLVQLKGGDRVLEEGDRAPDFTTFDHTGKEIRLSDLRGRKVWLWFFSSPGGNN